jgi:hypothetical protein
MMLMRETNHREDPSGDLDRILVTALAKYADATPREGLEERILTNLRTGQVEATRPWWTWGLAAAAVAAVAMLAIAVSLRFGKTADPVIANRPTASKPASSHSPLPAETQAASHETTVHLRAPRRAARHLAQPAAVVADGPKLDQFPSPQPLSEEELALVRYARSFPKDATMIAQSQKEFDLAAERQMNDSTLQNQPSSSVQQER